MNRLILCLALVSATACGPKPTLTTPQGVTAYRADQVVVRINELQNAAIAANQQHQLSDAVTRTIVEFCVSADTTLAQTPQGWQATLQTAWAEAKPKIPTTNPALVAAMSAVDVVVAGVK